MTLNCQKCWKYNQNFCRRIKMNWIDKNYSFVEKAKQTFKRNRPSKSKQIVLGLIALVATNAIES